MPVTAIQGFCVKHAVLAAALAAALPSLQASPAHAQDAPTIARATELDGIVVTGSKRDTPYLRSDISVTVLDRDALQQANVTEFRDLDKLAPNVKFNVMGQLSDMFISIRGIESNPFLVNRASVYIDGIPFRELSNAVLNHVESVEILRGPQGTLYGANSESGLVLVRTRAPGMFEYEYLPLDVGLYNQRYADLYNGGRHAGDFTYINDAPKRTSKTENVAGASAQWQLARGTVDAAVSYREQRDTSGGYDFDMTNTPALAGRIHDAQRNWNGELRFSSLDDQPLTWIGGVSTYRVNKDSVLGTRVGPPPRGLESYVLAPLQGSDGQDYSVFGTLSYTPPALPKLTASLGLRYEQARRSTRQSAGELDLGPGGLVFYRDAELSHTFTATLPRVSLRYDASDTLSFYAASAKGYIPGGFNLAAAQNDVVNDKVLRYESEMMWSHEAGFKMNVLGGRGHIGGAVFQIASNNWQEIQLATDANGRPISSDYVGSDASIRSRGVELEGVLQPLRGLTLTANAGYVDAQYRKLLVGDNQSLAGNKVKLTPQYTAYLAARYQHRSGVFARVESAFNGRMALDERNRAFQPAVAIIGVQLGYETGPWTTRVYVDNLTNKRRINGLIFDNLAFGRDGNVYGPVDRPRIIGAEVGYRF